MIKKKRTYDLDFKLQAVRMVKDQGLSIAQVSRDLNTCESNVSNWLKAFETGKLDKNGACKQLTNEEKRILVLETEVRLLREDNEILKKAAIIFARNC